MNFNGGKEVNLTVKKFKLTHQKDGSIIIYTTDANDAENPMFFLWS